METKILISEELSNYIEGLSYSAASLRDLLLDAAERGLQWSPAFERWEQKYIETDAEFQVAKGQLEREYVLPKIGDKRVNWTLDYNTRTVTIVEVEE